MSLRMWTVALSAYQIEDTKCKSPGCFKMLLLIDSQTAILSVCQQFVGVQCVHTLHTDYSLHLESCDWHSRAFSQPVIILPSRGQIPLHHVAFIPTFLKHSLQPLRHERVIQAILTFVQD